MKGKKRKKERDKDTIDKILRHKGRKYIVQLEEAEGGS